MKSVRRRFVTEKELIKYEEKQREKLCQLAEPYGRALRGQDLQPVKRPAKSSHTLYNEMIDSIRSSIAMERTYQSERSRSVPATLKRSDGDGYNLPFLYFQIEQKNYNARAQVAGPGARSYGNSSNYKLESIQLRRQRLALKLYKDYRGDELESGIPAEIPLLEKVSHNKVGPNLRAHAGNFRKSGFTTGKHDFALDSKLVPERGHLAPNRGDSTAEQNEYSYEEVYELSVK